MNNVCPSAVSGCASPALSSGPGNAFVPYAEPTPTSASDGWRVLVAGGEPAWFAKVQRDFKCLHANWICTHLADSSQLPGQLAQQPWDVILLSPVTPAEKTCLEPLTGSNDIIRLLRCEFQDRPVLEWCSRHGVIPVRHDENASELAEHIERADRLRTWTSSPAIKKLLPQLKKLPVAPDLYNQVTALLRKADTSIDEVAELISHDPVMVAKLLQVVNSAFFGLAYEIQDPVEAVMFLGIERTRALLLLAGMFSQYDNANCEGLQKRVFPHSLQVGTFARAIALAETRDTRTAEAAFTAGLLHDIGKLVLAGNLPEMYGSVCKAQALKIEPALLAEKRALGTTHAELGACLLGTWGLSLPILEAIAWHHDPEASGQTSFSLLTAVHAANAFAHESGGAGAGPGRPEQIHVKYLLSLKRGDKRNEWREICGVPPREEQTEVDRAIRRREAKQN